eukprot:Skav202248  [mRNA]  locus=scaffold1417:212434:213114:+ [translate_table: standard]
MRLLPLVPLMHFLAAGIRRDTIKVGSDADLPSQGEKCVPGCQQVNEWEPWEDVTPSEGDGCCAEGLVCDKDTSTCELALGQSCRPAETTTTTKAPKKGFLKVKFPKIFERKKPEMEAPFPGERCAKYFLDHKTACIQGTCCVLDFPLMTMPARIIPHCWVYNKIFPSPYWQKQGQAYVPPDDSSQNCCGREAYQWPDGSKACVSTDGVTMREQAQKLMDRHLKRLP